MKTILSSLLLAMCSMVAVPAAAGVVTIDFEHTPGLDGMLGTADDVPMADTFLQTLGTQFSSLGLTFTQGSLLQADFYNGDASNHFISSASPIATLSKAASSVSIESYSMWHATLTVFGMDGLAFGTHRLENPAEGASFMRGLLPYTSAQPIYGFSVQPDNPNYILNLDQLVLTFIEDDREVPEPSLPALFGLGLAFAALSLRARAGKRG